MKSKSLKFFYACAAAVLSLSCAASSVTQDGGFDSQFNGATGRSSSPSLNANFTVVGAAIAPDDSVILGGVCTATAASSFTGSVFCIQKWMPTGSVAVSASPASDKNRLNPTAIGDLLIQPDGKILVTAGCRAFTSSVADSFYVIRFNANLTVDTTFADGFAGNVNPGSTLSANNRPYKLALQSDGKILMAGACGSTSNPALV
jgi:Domain of unknown function (DUF5122) beta-propeller